MSGIVSPFWYWVRLVNDEVRRVGRFEIFESALVPSIPCVGLPCDELWVDESPALVFKSDVDAEAPLPGATVDRLNVMVRLVAALYERATVGHPTRMSSSLQVARATVQSILEVVTRKRVGELAWTALDILSSHSSKLVASCNNHRRSGRFNFQE